MAVDLNDSAPQLPLYDLLNLTHALAERAQEWVPRLFPNGTRDSDEIRLADITGRAPRKQGSCVIPLIGEHAGSFHDFDGGDHGGPLTTIERKTGLTGRALFDYAANLIGYKPVNGAAHPKQAVTKPEPPSHEQEISYILSRCVPATGTLAETYLTEARKLLLPATEDIKFNADIVDWKSKIGRPAMIAIVRDKAGNPTGGIHRTYLKPDGSGKAEMPKPRLTLGPIKGGAVRLGEIGADGRLGVGEGLESSIAAMMRYEVPVWSTLSTEGMASFEFPDGIKDLWIFCDAGKPGLVAATKLEERAAAAGISTKRILPLSGDDFNTDTMQSIPLSQAKTQAHQALNGSFEPENALAVADAISRLTKTSHPNDISATLKLVATANMDRIAQRQALMSIKDRTKVPVVDLQKSLREMLPSVSAPAERGDWVARMIQNGDGEPKPILENAATVLQFASEWENVIWWDEFSVKPIFRRPPPYHDPHEEWMQRPCSDLDDLETTRWLQRAGLHVPTAIVHDAIMAVAAKNKFHPVREYLDSLEWDGVPRIDTWLPTYCATDDTPFIRTIGAKWLISAVARAFVPGIKVDHMLILEGEQGLKKSTAMRVLGDPWFADELSAMGTKDASLELMGVWIMEIAELSSVRKSEVYNLNAFITRTTDHFRPPYGRHVMDVLRQCVFAGTINPEGGGYLLDSTGGRRFWPVKCNGPLDTDGLWSVKNQIWAEAKVRFDAGEKFYIQDPEVLAQAKSEQAARSTDDAIDSVISNWIEDRPYTLTETSIADVLSGIGIEKSKWTRTDQLRVSIFLTKSGWSRFHKRVGQRFEWRYRRTVKDESLSNDSSFELE